MDLSQFSQDILETQNPFLRPEGSPTKGVLLQSWNCTEVSSYDFKAWDDMSNGSHQLPSLGLADKLPDIIEFQNWNIASSELDTSEGIDDLTHGAVQLFHDVRDMNNPISTKEFLHVLTIFEHIGVSGQLSEDVLRHLDHSLMRILMKVGSVTLNEVSLRKHAVMNPCLHACIFSWKVAYSVYTASKSISSEAYQRRMALLNELLTTTALRLVKIYENYKSVAPCSCMQSFLFLLFGDKEKKFEEAFIKCFQSLKQTGTVENGTSLKMRECPSAMAFFNYYVELTEYFMDVHRLKKDGEWTGRFLLRVFGMAEQLIAHDLVQICETLVRFLDKNDPGSLARLRMVSKRFWTEIVKHLEAKPIRELETTAKEAANFWAEKVLTSFAEMPVRETYLLRLLTKFMTDKTLWESTRTLIKNHFASRKIASRPQAAATMLSMLMNLCTVQNVGAELLEPENLPSWLIEAVEAVNPALQTIAFNANRALGEICRESGCNYPTEEVRAKMINRLPLPDSSQLYLDQLHALSPYHKTVGIDFSRAEYLPEEDFSCLIEHFVDADWPLAQKVWQRAYALVETGRANETTRSFVYNQLRGGLQEKDLFYINRLNGLVEKYSKDPFRLEVLHFCSRVVEPGRQYNLDIDKFVPIWISSIVAFATSNEVEVRHLTRSIWDGICQVVQKSGGVQGEMDGVMEWEEPTTYVAKMFQALSSSPNHQWALQKLGVWFPSSLAQPLQALTKRRETDETTEGRRSRAIMVVCSLLESCSSLLYERAEQNETRVPFNSSPLVIAVCAVTDREILQRRPSGLNELMAAVVSGLAKVNPTARRSIFIRSRLKDILLAYSNEPRGVELAKTLQNGSAAWADQVKKENPLLQQLFD